MKMATILTFICLCLTLICKYENEHLLHHKCPLSAEETLHGLGCYPVSACPKETDSFHCLLTCPKFLLPVGQYSWA